MKTNDELNDLARQIYLAYDADDLPAARKLQRSIEIAALREVWEMIESSVRYYSPTVPEACEVEDHMRHISLQKLNALIRDLELK